VLFNGMPLPDGSDEFILTDHCIVSSRPNPFNSSTTVDYVLTEAVFTSLKVYDLNGRMVDVLHVVPMYRRQGSSMPMRYQRYGVFNLR